MKVESMVYQLMAQDMDRAIAFYRDVVGLTVKFQSPRWTELAFDGSTIALHAGGTGEFNPTGLGLTVSDIDAACDEVRNAGGKVLRGPSTGHIEELKLAELVDTEGNGFELAEKV